MANDSKVNGPQGQSFIEPGEIAPNQENAPYPVDAYPPIAKSAINEYQGYGQQPISMVAASALAQMALVTQGHANVARDSNLIGTISINQLLMAESGERKTASDVAMSKATREWQEDEREKLLPDNAKGKVIMHTLLERKKAVISKIASLETKNNSSDDIKKYERRLEEIVDQILNFIIPPMPDQFVEDFTSEGFLHQLAVGWPSIIVSSNEGGTVLGSRGFSDDSALGTYAALNKLWDGSTITQTRKQAKAEDVEGVRVSVCLMFQPHLLADMIKAGGRSLGFFARCLLQRPVSTMGQRPYQAPKNNMANVDAFNARAKELLNLGLPVNSKFRLEPPVMKLSPPAFLLWRDYHDETEQQMGMFGEYSTITDVAAKSAENAARLACVFQVWNDGPGGDISALHMESGIRLARWHLNEALQIFFEADKPQELQDAELLSKWLSTDGLTHLNDTSSTPPGTIAIRLLSQYGPYKLRDLKRRDAAIKKLTHPEIDHLHRITWNRKSILIVNPLLIVGTEK